MNLAQFNKEYDPNKKCYVKYRDANGWIHLGLLLQGVSTALNGNKFVYVNSFTNRVSLDRLISLSVSMETWYQQ